MNEKLMQVGSDAQSLARYIMENGNQSDLRVIVAQTKLLMTHVAGYQESLTEVKGSLIGA